MGDDRRESRCGSWIFNVVRHGVQPNKSSRLFVSEWKIDAVSRCGYRRQEINGATKLSPTRHGISPRCTDADRCHTCIDSSERCRSGDARGDVPGRETIGAKRNTSTGARLRSQEEIIAEPTNSGSCRQIMRCQITQVTLNSVHAR